MMYSFSSTYSDQGIFFCSSNNFCNDSESRRINNIYFNAYNLYNCLLLELDANDEKFNSSSIIRFICCSSRPG